jgi:protein SCO1/2
LIFGYTSCPDICPTLLSELAENLAELGKKAGELNWVFITVDPKHDTPGRLKAYLAAFSPQIIGLTGSPHNVSLALNGYRVFRAARPHPDGTYSIDHTSTVFLISAGGRLQDTIRESDLGTESALTKIKRLISS